MPYDTKLQPDDNQIDAVPRDRAPSCRKQVADQLGQRRLAGPVGAHDRHDLPATQLEAHRATQWPQERRAKLRRAQFDDFRNLNEKLSSCDQAE